MFLIAKERQIRMINDLPKVAKGVNDRLATPLEGQRKAWDQSVKRSITPEERTIVAAHLGNLMGLNQIKKLQI